MAGERLNLMPEEPDFTDPLFLPIFEILNKVLQPDSELSVEDAVAQLVVLFPEGKPYSSEVGDFISICMEMVDAIPYTHPSMLKLVSIIDLCLHSERFPEKVGSGKIQTDPTLRSSKLGENMRDWCDGTRIEDGPAKYVNFHTFVARIHQRGLLKGSILAVGALEDAFQRKLGKSQEQREAYVTAALQYLLLNGDSIYEDIRNDERWKHSWPCWRNEVARLAAINLNDKRSLWSQEIVEMAGRALTAMEGIERVKAG